MILQPIDDLEKWHIKSDPWNYINNEDDKKRKLILLEKLPKIDYSNVLDIGCGQGFITSDLPGKNILGVDISENAIKHAKAHEKKGLKYKHGDIYNISKVTKKKFDLVIITGVVYPQYIGESHNLIYLEVDEILENNGILVCVHIDEWYKARFPYLLLNTTFYDYREFVHRLEIYQK